MLKELTTLLAFRKPVLAILCASAVLAACGSAQPTPSADQIQAQIQAAVALTVAAQNTQTAQAQPAATETPVPAATETPTELPTLTPVLSFPSATTVVVSGGGGGGGGFVQPAYACDPDIDKRPLDYSYSNSNSNYAPGDHFDIKWKIKNTGTATWVAGLDLTFDSGVQMTSFTGPISLPQMKPGAIFTVPTLDAVAPNKKGIQVMVWKLQGGWCFPYVRIFVR